MSKRADYRTISLNGLWNNNPALVQLLGLCPLLGVSNSVVNALGLGIATIFVLTGSNIAVSLIRTQASEAIRLPAFVMIIASLTTCVELLMQAFTYELYQILGIFIPLIVTNCAILGRAEAYAAKNPVLPSAVDGFMMGTGFALVLLLLGGLRELIGKGTLFSGMELLLGPGAAHWELVVFADYQKFLFAILPPGAFVIMGFIIAGKNLVDAHLKARQAATPKPTPALEDAEAP
ncbi:electron transport complex subunit E [Aestuariirhabdus litorea]|uniref:Ion-translocating oxidoreductase complex subunit E n=1 Tax=Aestuariirhabdus litorea TaxID=2528527 RepID=A0A3P3VQR0_9GAMM|nr:electron transport complex subunit E [Aestuariirhabdus litorea]RRJ85131.1 electron transport complex subunit E [Aestuariirhabdus litorea]RWW98717.1 RnfABCDGE type electron transport complex subunit E [Endozoicomonadaceae bacterium GTF-13]